jgi:hypothetical protein
MKKMTAKTFEETFKPVWIRVRKLGLSKEDVDTLIQEVRTKAG